MDRKMDKAEHLALKYFRMLDEVEKYVVLGKIAEVLKDKLERVEKTDTAVEDYHEKVCKEIGDYLETLESQMMESEIPEGIFTDPFRPVMKRPLRLTFGIRHDHSFAERLISNLRSFDV